MEDTLIPENVVDMMRRITEHMEAYGLQDTPERRLIALRLLNDKRMLGVWKRLRRPHSKRSFFYPARIDALNPASAGLEYITERSRILKELGDADSALEAKWLKQSGEQLKNDQLGYHKLIQSLSPAQRQDWACGTFYLQAFWSAATKVRVFTASDVDAVAERFEAMSASLREIGTAVELWRDYGISLDVEPVALEFEKMSRVFLSRKGEGLFVDRHRGDDFVRAFALRLEAAARHIFGTSFYGTVATVTNVALDRNDVTGVQVRELVRR